VDINPTHTSKKVQNTQDTVLRTQKGQQLKCSSEDASVPLRREKKAVTSGERGRNLREKVDGRWGSCEGRGEPDLVLSEGKGLKP
jgi:hypothetical protein